MKKSASTALVLVVLCSLLQACPVDKLAEMGTAEWVVDAPRSERPAPSEGRAGAVDRVASLPVSACQSLTVHAWRYQMQRFFHVRGFQQFAACGACRQPELRWPWPTVAFPAAPVLREQK